MDRFIDVEAARAARGLRLVVLSGLPSPWSDAARGLCAAKWLTPALVRFRPGDAAVSAWTGRSSAPVAVFDDDPPVDRWDELLELTERLAPARPLIPAGPDRSLMFELGATLCGEGGLAWSRRLLVIHHSLESGGRVGFSPPLARYLADKYGYTAEGVPAARARQVELLRGLDQQVARQRAAGSPYLVGARLTAADIYLAATLGSMAPPAQGVRPIIKALRPVFEHLDPEIAAALTPALLAHRDRIAPWLPHQ